MHQPISYTDQRRAYKFGIINGILFAIGMAFMDPITVLPAFVSRLTTSEIAVGSISAIGTSGWFLPQILVANYLQSRPLKRPVYIFAATFRFFSLLATIAIAYSLAGAAPLLALIGFFLSYTCYSMSGGISGPAFLDIVAKTIPSGKLGAFFGYRQFWGGLGAIGAGALVRFILSPEVLPFPQDYTLLFAASLLFMAPGWLLFALVREPPGRITDDPLPLLPFLRNIPQTVRSNLAFRRLLASRLLTGATAIALPFYIIYARRVLEVPESTVGLYISIQMAGSVVLVPLWAYLNDRRGSRLLIITVALLSCAVTVIAFITSLFPPTPLHNFALFTVFFPLAAIGLGSFTGYTNYLFDISPEHQRTLYIGIHNTLFAVTSFLPLLGGFIVSAFSFSTLFAIATFFAIAGLAVTFRLPPQSIARS